MGILDSCLDVLLSKVLEGVYVLDALHEDVVEDVVDPGSSQAIDNTFLHELAFNHISIGGCESVDQIEYHGTFFLCETSVLEI